MTEAHDQHCNNCGTAFTGEGTCGLCPCCLLEMNLASRTMPGGEAPPQVPPPSPEEIADRFPQFEILECLGRGGMGIVYKARQKALNRLVAIKVLAGERRDDPQFEARFSREAQTLAQLSHPNIVTVHDFGESDGMFYLVMEFVDGVNLRDVLRDGRMESEQALAVVPEICEALQFAHDRGIVHRDIKPENILMDRDGRIKIADFGIATLVGASGERSGTPPYMAPEQGEATTEIDHRADIYALGVVFYEMLTGERPQGDPTRPSRQVEIDVRLDEIVLRALEKEPEQRYQTAGEFRTMVQTMEARPQAPPPAPARSATQQHSAGPVRGRWQAWVAALLLIGSLTGWGVLVYLTKVLPRQLVERERQEAELSTAMVWLSESGLLSQRVGLFVVPLLFLVTGASLVWLIVSVIRSRRQSAGGGSDAGKPEHRSRVAAWILRLFAPSVVVSGGERFVNWPGLIRNTLVLAGIYFILWLCGGAPWLFSDFAIGHQYSLLGGWVLTAMAMLGLGLFRGFEISHDRRRFRALVERGGEAALRKRPWVLLPLFGIVLLVVGLGIWGLNSSRGLGGWLRGVKQGTGSTPQAETADNTPEQVVRDHADAIFSGDVERALSFLAPPLSETREEIGKWILLGQVRRHEGAERVEVVEWHKEGGYAVAGYRSPPEAMRSPMPFKPYVILQRAGTDWKIVWSSVSRVERSLANELNTFRKFRMVDRRDPKAVAQAFIGAIRKGDPDMAYMLSGFPMSGNPGEMARVFARADREEPGSDPVVPQRWHEEGDYAVTRVKMFVDRPELETYLALKRTGRIWQVVWASASGPEASLADDLERFKKETMVGRVMVEDLALRFLVAIREKDEETLRKLCVDRTKGWTDTLVGQFAMELRERFRQQTGEEFTLYPGTLEVDRERKEKDLAVVQCVAAKELQPKLDGGVLVLHFCRTGDGWKVWAISEAKESQSLEEHLAKDRERAADWEDEVTDASGDRAGLSTPEQVAFAFMSALEHGGMDDVAACIGSEMKATEGLREQLEGIAGQLHNAYAGELKRLTKFTEWYPEQRDVSARFIGTRIAGASGKNGAGFKGGLYLIMAPTRDGWKVVHYDEARPDKPLSYYVDRIMRIIPGEGPEFRQVPAPTGAAATRSAGSDVQSPDVVTIVKQAYLPVANRRDVPVVLDLASGEMLDFPPVEGEGEFIGYFNKLGKGDLMWDHELITLRGARVNEWNKGVWDLLVPAVEEAGCASYRYDRYKLPQHLLITTAEGGRYTVKVLAGKQGGVNIEYHLGAIPPAAESDTDRPAAPPSAALNTMRIYATAIVTYKVDHGTLPPDLQTLVDRNFLREAMLMKNHKTGKMEMPLYFGRPEVRKNSTLVSSKFILLAAPTADQVGKRVVGFLDSHVETLDEAEYQKALKAQEKPMGREGE